VLTPPGNSGTDIRSSKKAWIIVEYMKSNKKAIEI
jgi:hypothetical protein